MRKTLQKAQVRLARGVGSRPDASRATNVSFDAGVDAARVPASHGRAAKDSGRLVSTVRWGGSAKGVATDADLHARTLDDAVSVARTTGALVGRVLRVA